MKSECINLLRADTKGKIYVLYVVSLDFIQFFCFAEIKRNITSADYVTSLFQKLNRYIFANANAIRYHGKN
jgi:hypothetical protein